jgi:hypothetical protein
MGDGDGKETAIPPGTLGSTQQGHCSLDPEATLIIIIIIISKISLNLFGVPGYILYIGNQCLLSKEIQKSILDIHCYLLDSSNFAGKTQAFFLIPRLGVYTIQNPFGRMTLSARTVREKKRIFQSAKQQTDEVP